MRSSGAVDWAWHGADILALALLYRAVRCALEATGRGPRTATGLAAVGLALPVAAVFAGAPPGMGLVALCLFHFGAGLAALAHDGAGRAHMSGGLSAGALAALGPAPAIAALAATLLGAVTGPPARRVADLALVLFPPAIVILGIAVASLIATGQPDAVHALPMLGHEAPAPAAEHAPPVAPEDWGLAALHLAALAPLALAAPLLRRGAPGSFAGLRLVLGLWAAAATLGSAGLDPRALALLAGSAGLVAMAGLRHLPAILLAPLVAAGAAGFISMQMVQARETPARAAPMAVWQLMGPAPTAPLAWGVRPDFAAAHPGTLPSLAWQGDRLVYRLPAEED